MESICIQVGGSAKADTSAKVDGLPKAEVSAKVGGSAKVGVLKP